MSVIIRDMEIPKAKESCRFYEEVPFRPTGYCYLQCDCGFPEHCPLEESNSEEEK